MNNFLNKYFYDFRLNIIIDIASIIVLVNVAVSSQPNSLFAILSYIILGVLAVALVIRVVQITKITKKEEIIFNDTQSNKQGIVNSPGGKIGLYQVLSSLSFVAIVLLIVLITAKDSISSWFIYALILFYGIMVVVSIIFYTIDRKPVK